MNGNCKTVISTSAKLMCSANPSRCVAQETHGTMLFRAEKCPVIALLMWSGIIEQWRPFPPLLLSRAHSSNPARPHLYVHIAALPDSSLDVQRMLWNNSSFCVASCVNNAGINPPPCIHERMNRLLM